MKLFKKQRQPPVSVQLRSREPHPFGVLSGYTPAGRGEIKIYRAIREAVPIVDAAILKIIRLTGGFRLQCQNAGLERRLNSFAGNVDAGRGQKGLEAFIEGYLDSMITCGMGIGEIAMRGREIGAVLWGDPENIYIKEGDTPLDFKICALSGGEIKPLPHQELLLFTPFNPEADRPCGVSMLRSMPFLADILLKIYNSIGINWDRAGNVRYAVTYKPQGDVLDRACAGERARQIAQEWSSAMQSGKDGSIRDFVAVGDVDIKVIGADNQILDSEAPVRQILEQLLSRTGIPPFMLGLSWSSTERMSAQQADIMTTEITAIRRTLTPVIERICDIWLYLQGEAAEYQVVWDDINLQDQVEEARAGLYIAQTREIQNREKGGE